MIERILPNINDPADYIDALALLKADTIPATEEWDGLLALYTKYLPEEDSGDRDYVILCLALDLMIANGNAEKADFDGRRLSKYDLDALFWVWELVGVKEDVDLPKAKAVTELAQEGQLSETARILLARTALDAMAASRNYLDMRAQIAEMAEILTGSDTARLDRCTRLLREVRYKCGKM